jgi:hypothetical protein
MELAGGTRIYVDPAPNAIHLWRKMKKDAEKRHTKYTIHHNSNSFWGYLLNKVGILSKISYLCTNTIVLLL